jgi:hypothetical protein
MFQSVFQALMQSERGFIHGTFISLEDRVAEEPQILCAKFDLAVSEACIQGK